MLRITSKQGREALSGVRGIIFDLAGTLIDNGCRAPVHAMTSAFAKNGLLVSDEIVCADMGLPKRTHIKAILNKPTMLGKWECIFNNPPREIDIDRIYQSTNEELKRVVKKYSKPTPFAVELLNNLHANGIRIGITTGYSREIIDTLWDELHKEGIIYNNLVCADEVRNPRPQAGMIFKILKEWKLTDYSPDMIIKIGDTVADIQEAHSAKIISCQVIDTCSDLGHIIKSGDLGDNREWLNYNRAAILNKFKNAGADFYCRNLGDFLKK